MVIEMSRYERNIDVATLANGFAVVERFQNGQQTRVLLDLSGQCVQEPRALMAREFLPRRPCGTCCCDSFVDIGSASLRDVGQLFARCGITGLEIFSFSGRLPFAADEVAKLAGTLLEP